MQLKPHFPIRGQALFSDRTSSMVFRSPDEDFTAAVQCRLPVPKAMVPPNPLQDEFHFLFDSIMHLNLFMVEPTGPSPLTGGFRQPFVHVQGGTQSKRSGKYWNGGRNHNCVGPGRRSGLRILGGAPHSEY